MAWVSCCLATGSLLAAEPVRITGAGLTAQNQLRIEHTANAASYYILYRGNHPSRITLPVDLKETTGTSGTLTDASPPAPEAFYRVREVASSAPLDTDGDGTDDLAELLAGTDPLRSSALAPTAYTTSPVNGELGVAVTRETILRFSNPLSADAVLQRDDLFAEVAGRRLLSRVHLSEDRRTATLFYLEEVPGSARVRVTFSGNNLRDSAGQLVDGDLDGRPGGTGIFEYDTYSLTPLEGTAVIGRVFASDPSPDPANPGSFVQRPLRGVTITVDGREQDLRTITDAEGRFRLHPVPSGRFFVHVDGRTAEGSQWPGGDYYPVVGKAWEAEPGRQENLASGTGEIFLPLIKSGTLTTVSATESTPVTFPPSVLAQNPELEGVQVVVPPNSLFNDNGTRGGQVGIAPVPPDRLPEPLPAGLQFPLVITVQTDGPLNFDVPVPVRFPNLPDPKTGEVLPPGAKSALWSFNHDTGTWEIAGAMTVSADGRFVESDPGVGIRQPGWHGTQPGVGASGGPIAGPPCDKHGPGENCRQNPDFVPDDPANYNGCGPDGWDYLVPDNPNFPIGCASFFPGCRSHDIGYNTCGKPQQETDDRFLQDMLAACQCIANAIDKLACIAAAHAYHAAVTSGGEDAYDAAQDKACICEEPPPCGANGGGPSGPGVNSFRAQNLRMGVHRKATTGIPEGYVPLTGPHRFAVIDLETLQVVQRGRAGMAGIAFAQLILAPNRSYHIAILQEATLWEGRVEISTGQSGSFLSIPPILVGPPVSWDFDADGLHDAGELIMGTASDDADSDNDGINDGTEVKLGLNPLGEAQLITGVIASAATSGTAVDVAAVNNLAAVALSSAGVALFDISAMNPVLAAQVATAGSAVRVAWSDRLLAVASGTGGLTVIDAQQPSRPVVLYQLPLGNAIAVAAAADLAYVGLQSGEVVLVELNSATILRRLPVGQPVRDLALGRDVLYALTDSRLAALDIAGGDLVQVSVVNSPTVSTPHSRLRIGDRVAYAVHGKGFNTFDLSDPLHPQLIKASNTSQFGWEDIVPNGSGLGVSAVGTAFAYDQQRVFGLYDLNDPQRTDLFLTSFTHPGHARAVSIYNGLAYGAAHNAGLLVINYLAFDTEGEPPTISLDADFPLDPPQAEENKRVRVTANVGDDVQVRNVEFYLDDVLVANDGNFPFEHRFVTPRLTAGRTSFTLRAVAFDTGGNRSETGVQVQLVEDATPPRLLGVSPQRGQIVGAADLIAGFFNEPIDPQTVSLASFHATFAGADAVFGTADDRVLESGALEYRDDIYGVLMRFSAPLEAGFYRVSVNAPLSDLAGNSLVRDVSWEFLVLGQEDRDGDGIPDSVELLMNSDPENPDSNNNGILDGEEDHDGDRLRTSWELAYGYDPRVKDADSNGVDDGAEDPDRDSLANQQEQAARTNPLRADTDSDAWPDEAEITAGSDPLNPASLPRLMSVARPVLEVIAPRAVFGGGLGFGPTLANPPVEIIAPRAVFDGTAGFGTALATPVVEIILPRITFDGTVGFGSALATPPVEIIAPRAIFGAGFGFGQALASPPVEVILPAPVVDPDLWFGPYLAVPPVTLEFER